MPKKNVTPFTFDFESLYDSLDPELVKTALRAAMNSCRSHWPAELKDWILQLVQLSISASIGEFHGKFYKQRSGLPTGGSLIVEIANITVYYVLKEVLYDNPDLMKDVLAIKRYIDDGVGVHTMTERSFGIWKNKISAEVYRFGRLTIKESDWSTPEVRWGPVNFLDIKFWFDRDQNLQTDLYKKPTDARHYLSFNSCHPDFIFSGTVYSQGVRLRRIINNHERLCIRLEELSNDFIKCNYPKKLIEDIFDKVKKMERVLAKKEKKEEQDDNSVMVVSTYGRDSKLVKTLTQIEKQSKSIKFRYAKKTAASLNNMLVKSKEASLGKPKGKTMPCKTGKGRGRGKACMTCSMVSKKDYVVGPNKKRISTAKSCCKTRCVIYHASCHHCDKCYVGKTTQPLNNRVNGHRGKYYECLGFNGDRLDLDADDDYALGLHLYLQHGLRDREGFNDGYEFTVLERCNPRNIDLKEHLWIQRLKCIKPYGLNSHDPFGFLTTL